METDHLFITVKAAAAEMELLKQFGFTEGSKNQHAGQGTANRRIFFANTFLELLYLEDEGQAQSELTKPTRLFDRLTANKGASVCPFGICFRPKDGHDKPVPFSAWSYQPNYLPNHLKIDIGNAPLQEPMWFYLSFASRPDSVVFDEQQPLQHANGLSEITSVSLCIPDISVLSEAAQKAMQLDGVELLTGEAYIMTLGFDGEKSAQIKDFRPELPLIIKW